jgi:hypothetical protein
MFSIPPQLVSIVCYRYASIGTFRSPRAPSNLPCHHRLSHPNRYRSHWIAIPVNSRGQSDCYIDAIIKIFLAIQGHIKQQMQSIPLAAFVTTRPNAGTDEPILCWESMSVPNLITERTPAEDQIILGWCLDTPRRLVVKLPGDKFISWLSDIAEVLASSKIIFGDFESLVGHLNHAAYVIPLSRHFMNHLRKRILIRAHRKQELTLSKDELADLEL